MEALRDRDYRHLWHPYTNIDRYERGPWRCITRAEGVYLYDDGGTPKLDGIASWWCVALGHSHPRLLAAIQQQAAQLQHSILGNLAHAPAIELAARLAAIAPGPLNHVYFAADGSSATEAALKIAIQYWTNRGERGRTRFLCLEDGYHGDTLGAMGVGFVPHFHAPYAPVVAEAVRLPVPHAGCACGECASRDACLNRCMQAADQLFAAHAHEAAALIVEPLCQGAAGVRIYPAEYLRHLRQLCDRHNVLLIADEIAVGLGRTGDWFACSSAGVAPDLLCIGKALTGGYLPMSACIATGAIYDTFRDGPNGEDHTFYDGHTFCGNPICAAAALAALDEFEAAGLLARARVIGERLADAFAELATHPAVAHSACLGAIGMVSMADGAEAARAAAHHAWDHGLYIRPLGASLYLWPPLIATDDELAAMRAGFRAALDAVAGVSASL